MKDCLHEFKEHKLPFHIHYAPRLERMVIVDKEGLPPSIQLMRDVLNEYERLTEENREN